jgi:hypothetical protein
MWLVRRKLMNPNTLGALVTVATPVVSTPATVSTPAQPHVELQSGKMLIHELAVERPEILEYLRTIAPDKHEIALVHAIEVGVMEIMARKQRKPKAS